MRPHASAKLRLVPFTLYARDGDPCHTKNRVNAACQYWTREWHQHNLAVPDLDNPLWFCRSYSINQHSQATKRTRGSHCCDV
ncbi:unnamed protein product [Diplocarpon coronariae]